MEELARKGKVYCVWTGDELRKYHIDHVVPFAVWKNNDLWNLLPSSASKNSHKRDKIPSPKLVEKQKELILEYWHLMNAKHEQRFQKEIRIALLGESPSVTWEKHAIDKLKESCQYLISYRGYEEWKL
jgi:CRISPR/Cas system Type II protein with McrA/HNH and RuvC-like nuclease domain